MPGESALRHCEVCRVDYEPVRVDQRYCSPPCKSRRPRVGRRRYAERVCESCGEQYGPTYVQQRTCGRACGSAIRRPPASITVLRHRYQGRPKKPVVRQCRECDRYFMDLRRRFCDPGCRRAAQLREQRRTKNWGNRRKSPPSAPCIRCGEGEFPYPPRKCADCTRAYKRMRRKADKQRRRALKLGVASEPYTLVEIAARDGYRCGLCRGKVVMSLAVPHFKAPTIDHVVPMARGGDDTRANVQLAHFICNCRKSDRLAGDQLALVG